MAKLVAESPVKWLDQTAWHQIFCQAGLRAVRSKLWLDRVHFPSALDLVRAWHASGVTGQALLGPGRLRQAMRDYDTRFAGPAGVTSTWAWLAIEATPENETPQATA